MGPYKWRSTQFNKTCQTNRGTHCECLRSRTSIDPLLVFLDISYKRSWPQVPICGLLALDLTYQHLNNQFLFVEALCDIKSGASGAIDPVLKKYFQLSMSQLLTSPNKIFRVKSTVRQFSHFRIQENSRNNSREARRASRFSKPPVQNKKHQRR